MTACSSQGEVTTARQSFRVSCGLGLGSRKKLNKHGIQDPEKSLHYISCWKKSFLSSRCAYSLTVGALTITMGFGGI